MTTFHRQRTDPAHLSIRPEGMEIAMPLDLDDPQAIADRSRATRRARCGWFQPVPPRPSGSQA